MREIHEEITRDARTARQSLGPDKEEEEEREEEGSRGNPSMNPTVPRGRDAEPVENPGPSHPAMDAADAMES